MTTTGHAAARPGGWRREGSDLVRGASGGLLFGVPLLYTMEVWWYGSWVHPRWVLGALAISFLVVVALNRTSGFRDTRASGWRDAAADGVEMVALALLCAGAVLLLLRQVTVTTSLAEAVGVTVFEAIPFAFGAALSRQLLHRVEGEDDDDGGDDLADDVGVDDPAISRTLADAGAAAVGALVLAFSIAPTDEIPDIADSITPPWLLLIVGASLLISYAIVFAADFRDQAGRQAHEGLFQRPFPETVAAYVISLAVAALMLLFFQRIGPDQSWETWMTYTIVLGLPATIGGAAGRLAV